MTNSMKLPAWMSGLGARGGKAAAAPILIIMLLAMMILPLPAFVLDVFFSFNIALSIIVLLTALYTVKPLDFLAFPAILLVSTELEEVRALSDRIVVMSGGRVTGELHIDEFDTTRIGLLMGGMHKS